MAFRGRLTPGNVADMKAAAVWLMHTLRAEIPSGPVLAKAEYISMVTPAPGADEPVQIEGISFATRPLFNALALIVGVILVGLYVILW